MPEGTRFMTPWADEPMVLVHEFHHNGQDLVVLEIEHDEEDMYAGFVWATNGPTQPNLTCMVIAARNLDLCAEIAPD